MVSDNALNCFNFYQTEISYIYNKLNINTCTCIIVCLTTVKDNYDRTVLRFSLSVQNIQNFISWLLYEDSCKYKEVICSILSGSQTSVSKILLCLF